MSYDPQTFLAPKISRAEIRAKADEFRVKYSNGVLPVDISNILEFDLGISLQPVKSLKTNGDIDAVLLGTNDTILVDLDEFEDPRFQNRMRFSLAHEAGHILLHGPICGHFKPGSVEEWEKYIGEMDEKQYIEIEQQAYEFAGRLLVPVDVLKSKYDAAIAMLNGAGKSPEEFEPDTLREYIASHILKDFGVSKNVIKKRLIREGIF